MKTQSNAARQGTILIMIAAIAALIASLALSFLMRVRSDVEEMQGTLRDVQARLMLTAACQYIQEASRIGWDKTGGTQHQETFGWIDVRDGSLGPRSNTAAISTRPVNAPTPVDPAGAGPTGQQNFPIGKPMRFPMHVLTVPPCAISQHVAPNAISTAAPDSGRAYLRYPDPMPALSDPYRGRTPQNPAGTIDASGFAAWVAGDWTPRQATTNKSWFRLVREPTGAVFTVTCGAGGTQGYRDWQEVQDDAATQLFNDDKSQFSTLRSSETILWYRVEWSAAVNVPDMNVLREHREQTFRFSTPTYRAGGSDNGYSGQMYSPNMGGTIQWVQRLRVEPDLW